MTEIVKYRTQNINNFAQTYACQPRGTDLMTSLLTGHWHCGGRRLDW